MHPVSRAVAATCASILLSSSVALAVDRTWNQPAGGSYNTPGNWSGTVVPTASDNGIFTLNGANYIVVLNSGTTSGGMIVRPRAK